MRNQIPLEDLALLGNLGSLNSSKKLYEDGLREANIDVMNSASENASKIISGGEMDDLLLNASPQAWNFELKHYKKKNSEKIDQALGRSKEGLLEFYGGLIGNLKEKITQKANENTELDTDEKKKEFIKIGMYQSLALDLLLSGDFELNPNYDGDKELVNAYNAFKDFEKAKPEEKSSKTADAITEMYGLSKNARNLKNDWSPYADNIRLMYGRMLAQRLLDDELKLDKEKFEKAFGTKDNYAKIASMYLKEMQKQNSEG